jgi:23S rRNA G2445 N2-methylase RlmL
MTSLPIAAASASHIAADLPFGQRMGSHEVNLALYPRVLKEAGRVARVGARFVLITHEVHLMDRLLRDTALWSTESVISVNLRGLHPRIYVLRRL